ncbi:MAG: IPT/TIG domain-containing protein [Myxococcota bacterium]
MPRPFLVLAISASFVGFGCGAAAEATGELAILDIQPRTGDVNGEVPIVISGQNFRTDIGYTVYFGNQRATSVTILDPEQMRVTTPMRDETGPVEITVLADNGPAFRITNAFEYIVAGAGANATERGNLRY